MFIFTTTEVTKQMFCENLNFRSNSRYLSTTTLIKGEKLSNEAAAAETEKDLWSLFFTEEACNVMFFVLL